MPLLIAAGITAAGTLGSAYMSSQASNNAADATSEAAALANAEQRRQFDITRSDQQPWLTTGGSALNKLAGLYGLDTFTPNAPGSANGTPGAPQADTPGMIAAKNYSGSNGSGHGYGTVGALIGGPAGAAVGNLFKENRPYLGDIAAAMQNGTPITDAQWQQAGYGPNGSDPNAPFVPQGTFHAGTSQPGVDKFADFYQSPDYLFRLGQGIKGVDAGASARGALDSGATRKAEIQYAGNLGAGEYGNYANRLQALAGVGQTTATNLGQVGQNYANNVGANLNNAANNRASSYLANGQTYGNAIGGLAGIGSGLIQNRPNLNTYSNGSGGMYNGSYLAPFNSSAAAQGF